MKYNKRGWNGNDPVPINNEQTFIFAISIYSHLPAIVIGTVLVLCETKELNGNGVIKGAFKQHHNQSINQPTNQPSNSPTNKYRNRSSNKINHCSPWE